MLCYRNYIKRVVQPETVHSVSSVWLNANTASNCGKSLKTMRPSRLRKGAVAELIALGMVTLYGMSNADAL